MGQTVWQGLLRGVWVYFALIKLTNRKLPNLTISMKLDIFMKYRIKGTNYNIISRQCRLGKKAFALAKHSQ